MTGKYYRTLINGLLDLPALYFSNLPHDALITVIISMVIFRETRESSHVKFRECVCLFRLIRCIFYVH